MSPYKDTTPLGIMTGAVVDTALSLGLVTHEPETFRKLFQLRRSNSRYRAYGGVRPGRTGHPVPYIAMGKAYQSIHSCDHPGKFREYRRIQHDPEIGSYEGKGFECTRALVCHEVAHAITYWNWNLRFTERLPDQSLRARPKPHGNEWRALYRALRRFFGLVSKDQTEVEAPKRVAVMSAPASLNLVAYNELVTGESTMATAKKKAAAKKAAAKPKAPKAPKVEQNGVVRPKDGSKTGEVWAIADKLKGRKKDCPLRADVLAEAEKAGINPATAATQFGRWRTFNGFVGRIPKEKAAA